MSFDVGDLIVDIKIRYSKSTGLDLGLKTWAELPPALATNTIRPFTINSLLDIFRTIFCTKFLFPQFLQHYSPLCCVGTGLTIIRLPVQEVLQNVYKFFN
jgi:hypothetical protein